MLLQVQQIEKSYQNGEIQILKGVSLEVKQGEFISIMGPSGSGKSTLLQIIGGLDTPTAGSILVGSQRLELLGDTDLSLFRRRKLGFIFQFFHLVPTLTALENVALPCLLDGQSLNAVEKKAKDLMEFLGVAHRLQHYPFELSGGEMQRVAIARALIADPLLLLADEPTGNLDSKTGENVLSLLQKLSQEKKQTIIMVTHDQKAAQYGTRIVRFRDGTIESDQPVTRDLEN